VTVVIHANHGNELGPDVGAALRRLREAETTLLNQSVLLAGVNDDADTLQRLSEALHDLGVLPYYLHQLDRVQGAAHFSVPDARAVALHRELMAALPGYLVPKLVREMAGEANKSPLY
jgi:L-lysine 2,3-aminomutase